MISNQNFNKLRSTLSAEIEDKLKQNNITGMAIALVGREGILWTEGLGFTDASKKQPATPDSLFNLQSSGKMINATTFLRVMQRGLVALDTPLIEVYPEFHVNDRFDGQQYRQITFRHLLSHHAGLTHESPLGGNWDNRDLPFEDIIASINDTWMVAPVGQEHRYSNCGMSLAMYGLQRITGIPVRDLVRKEVIQPLGMDSMVYGKPAAMEHPEYVTGYDGDAMTLFESFSDLGAGCQYVSVRDFSNFVQMRLNDGSVNGQSYLDPDLLAEARTPQFHGPFMHSRAGLGLFLFPDILPGEMVYGHAGGGCGYSGEVLWSLEHGLGVIIQTNNESYGFPVALSFARKALKMAVEAKGIQVQAPEPVTITNRPAIELDLESVKCLQGDYAHYGTVVKVRVKEDRLVYELYGEEHTLTHHDDLIFTADYPPGMKFFLNEEGSPSHLMWLNGQGEFVRFHYDNISAAKPEGDFDDLDQYAGLYQGRVYGFRPYGAIRRVGNHIEASFFLFGGKLEQHQPGLFFAPDGEHIRVAGDLAWFGNRPVEQVHDPVGVLKLLIRENPDDYMLSGYNLNESLIPMLEFLGRDDEAEEVRKLTAQLYPEQD